LSAFHDLQLKLKAFYLCHLIASIHDLVNDFYLNDFEFSIANKISFEFYFT